MGKLKYIIFTAAVFAVILFSGCVGEQKGTPTATPPPPPQVTATVAPVVTTTPEITPTGNRALIELDSRRGFTPQTQTISAGDEIIWENTGAETITLISSDGFFTPQLLAFNKQYSYVFNQLGTYNFYLENNKNLNGTILVEVHLPTPTQTAATIKELPRNLIYVDARMESPAYWGPGNYSLDALQVQIYNQQNTPLAIKAQIVSGGQVLEEKSFSLDNEGSSYQFTNEKQHYINSTNVTLRLLIQGYQPVDYPFTVVSSLG